MRIVFKLIAKKREKSIYFKLMANDFECEHFYAAERIRCELNYTTLAYVQNSTFISLPLSKRLWPVCVCVCSNCIKILLRTFNAAKKILPNVPSAPITQKRAEEKVRLVQLVLSQHVCHFAGDVKITRNHLKKLKSQLNS